MTVHHATIARQSPADLAGWLHGFVTERLRCTTELGVTHDTRGAPVLIGVPLHVSVAHAGDQTLVVIADEGPIGCDLEPVGRAVYRRHHGAVVMAPDELDWIEQQADPDLAFLRSWVRKEAYAKRAGTGLHRRLASVVVTGAPDDPTVIDLTVAGHHAAIALPR